MWPRARRVERSGAGRYVKNDLENTGPVAWEIKSGSQVSLRTILKKLIATNPDTICAVGFTDRSEVRLEHFVFMRREHYVELLAEHGDINALNSGGNDGHI